MGFRVGGRLCCVVEVVVGRGIEGGGIREELFVVGEVIVGTSRLVGSSEDLLDSCRLSSGTCTTETVAEAFGVDCAESVSGVDGVSALFSWMSSGFACMTSGC